MYQFNLINAAMGARRLTNESLADLAGVTAPTISAIRNGKWNGKMSILQTVANVLEIPFHELVKEKVA